LKSNEELDIEWVKLIIEALELGIDKEDIRLFLRENKVV
jgi:hypothetical protein